MANYNSFSLLLLAIVTFVLACNSQNAFSQPISVNQFCRTATYKRLCTRMVNGAANLQDATASAIRVAIHIANKIEALTPAILEAASALDPSMKTQIVDTCKEGFENTVEDLNLSLDLLKHGDMGGVGTRLSAAFDCACTDALKEQGVVVPALARVNAKFEKVMDNALAVAFQS